MSVPAKRTDGETLALVAFDGKHFRFVSARAVAPGQPLIVALELSGGLVLELKSLGSVRRDQGDYEVRARATTLSRGAREALSGHFSGA